ncbi:UbiA family prenyltransferase [Ancylobacter pratisalsi]|uniref:UbiA family prenyltransferase n=1 Tax=Ancylobacter pratisalsi TaxID=1745854 RepID=A0A6P1YSQ5_9HYPH|nr:UbiA family prenyltransferase [Ancylobacter pratisalsi]QIB35831.1 UbiA family prenyltransferase [Ancylobacter pratisalsi]
MRIGSAGAVVADGEREFRGQDDLPLAVDLDGTLTPSDTLHEGLITYVKNSPNNLHHLWPHLRAGKAVFKRSIAERTVFDPTLLPYNEELLAWLRAEKARGRRIVLISAADRSIAEAVGAHLGLFDEVHGSLGVENLSGVRKLALIRETLGERFVYAGDSRVDVPIFQAAEKVVLVGDVARLETMLPPGKVIEQRFPNGSNGLRTWAKALRLGHWSKNVLVLVAPALALQTLSPWMAVQALILFVAMGLLASATYIVNDLLDLAADRQHPVKKDRPFASGRISARKGVMAGAGLVLATGVLALFLPPAVDLMLAVYAVVTLLYSFVLKRQAFIDVFVLAMLFTVRVLAGSLLLPPDVSPWLLTFSMLLFLSLAMVKRYAELNRVVESGGRDVVARGYTARDLPLLLAAGVASSFSAIVIFVIYLIAEQYSRDIYNQPGMLWATMPLILMWVLRIWHLTIHGQMSEDPVVFALKDRFSLALGALAVAALILAWA